ncbi:MAG: NAD-dependent epimerase/dehydratase family protein [Chloroflexota bacterium]|nr:NAD-dependent epimerase/dehydratase family protein [Chloroflexota bacterium]
MDKIKVAVIGAAGRIGPYLVRRLAVENAYEPVPVIRDKMAIRFLGEYRQLTRIGSITDSDSASRLIGDCQVVINLAFSGSTTKAIANNIKLVEAITTLQSVKVFINLSTISVHGLPFTESRMNFVKPKPTSAYGKSKLAMERIVADAFRKTNTKYFLLRLGNVYGPSQTVSRMVFEDVTSASFELPFGGNLASNAVSVQHFIDGIVSILNNPPPNGVYNCTDEPQRTWREIYDMHTDAWNLPPVASMSPESSYLLRKKVRISSGIESLPFRHKIKMMIKYFTNNSLVNNRISKKLYFTYREHIPMNIDNRIARTFGRTLSDVVIGRIAESAPNIFQKTTISLVLSDPVPGRNLKLEPSANISTVNSTEELVGWFRDLTEFRWDTSGLRM